MVSLVVAFAASYSLASAARLWNFNFISFDNIV
jgi:hypothetical protein